MSNTIDIKYFRLLKSVLVAFLFGITASAQTVSNVTAEQVGKTIHISYDLDKTTDISIFVSTSGGYGYRMLWQVSGDVGKKTKAGHNTIIWNVLEEMSELSGEDIVFKVVAKPIVSLPIVKTGNISNVAESSAFCNGVVNSDGNASVISRGVCWSAARNPTLKDNYTTDGVGTGFFISNITGLKDETRYYVRAYATNEVGTVYGKQTSFVTLKKSCPSTVKDYDGNVYNTVSVGTQCWMAQNLRTTHYSDGTFIPQKNRSSAAIAYRYFPGDNSIHVKMYGYLYNWKAVMKESSSSDANPSSVQGICPNGWHVPSDAEWTYLVDHLIDKEIFMCGHDKAMIAKAIASDGWKESLTECSVGYEQNTNNDTGFGAPPAGMYSSERLSCCRKDYAFYWSATEKNNRDAWYRCLSWDSPYFIRHSYKKTDGYSVRCLKD